GRFATETRLGGKGRRHPVLCAFNISRTDSVAAGEVHAPTATCHNAPEQSGVMTERHCAASRRFSWKRIQPRWTPCLSVLYLRCMSSVEEYRNRSKKARKKADTSCIELERQGLLIIA